jgi:hypothetical protein
VTVKRRHNGGKELQWLELITRVKEGTKELRKVTKWGGEGGGLIAFYRG